MSSIVKPLSIKTPNTAVPSAVENTMKAVVKALILPMYFTPYISAHVDDPNMFPKPLEIPTNPKKKYAEISCLLKNKTTIANNKGIFIIGINFRLVNLSTKKPDEKSVMIEAIE